MRQLLTYFVEVMIISGVLYGYYHFFLRNKRFHQYNRFYLLIASVLSVVLPFVNIPVYLQPDAESAVMLETLQVVVTDGPGTMDGVQVAPITDAGSVEWWPGILYAVYAAGGLVLAIRFLLALRTIFRLRASHPVTPLDGIEFIGTTEPGTPFSFFKWLFWHNEIDVKTERGEQIFRHELFHIRQKHSADILMMEFLTIIFWVNPFFHIIRKEITAIHEFLADRYATGAAVDPYYAELLLMNAIGTRQKLINPFFHNQIKRRIAMIIQPDKTRFQYFRKILALPLTILLFGAFALSFREMPVDKLPPSKLKVVIEAAHGGPDGGAQSADGSQREGALMLDLAKEIYRLAPEYGVEVLLARDNESRVGNAGNNGEALKKSVALAKDNNADLYLSLHMNAAAEHAKNKTGIEAYISSQRADKKSEQLSSILLQRLSKLYTTDLRVRKSAQTIYVLDKNVCPAVLLELGYINNPADLAFVTNKANQEKLARQILSSVVDYGSNSNPVLMLTPAAVKDTVPASAKQKEVVVIGRPSGMMNDSVLVVVDGVIKTGNTTKSLNAIEPNSIKSVNILRGEQATGLYGAKAVNGVIEIKTKNLDVVELKEMVVEGYQKKKEEEVKEVVVEGYQTKKNDELKEVTVEGYASKKPVREVVVEGRPTTPSLEEVVVVGYGQPLQQEPIFTKVEIEPGFKGGVEAWRKFLQRNLNSKVPLENGAPAGNYTVFIQFVVDKEGNLSQFKTLTNHGFGMEEEVVRVLRSGPKWLPAYQNGKPVNAIRKQPVTFSVVREVVKN